MATLICEKEGAMHDSHTCLVSVLLLALALSPPCYSDSCWDSLCLVFSRDCEGRCLRYPSNATIEMVRCPECNYNCRFDGVLQMISPEVIQSCLHSQILVYTIKLALEEDGLGSYWDSDWFKYLTDSLPNSSFLPFHRVIYLVLSWADCAPEFLYSPHCWAQRFLTRMVYTHFEGELYFEPPGEYDDYPLE